MKGLFLVLSCTLAVSSGAGAQGTLCYPLRSDSLHREYIKNIRNYTSDADSSWAAAGVALGYPRVDSSQVSLVRDKNTCKTAAQKFADNVPAQAFSPPSGKVYVFRVGPSRYFVVDPDYYLTEYHTFQLLFTSAWALVSRQGN